MANEGASPKQRSEWQSIPEGKGKQRIRKYIGTDPVTGKRRIVSKVFPAKEKKSVIRDWIASERTKFNDPLSVAPNELKVGQLFKHWLERRKGDWATEHTAKQYQGLFKRHCSSIANYRVQALKRPQVAAVFTKMAAAGLSDTSIGKVYTLLKQVFQWAIDVEEVLARNPLPDKRYLSKGKAKNDILVLSSEECGRFLAACEGSRFETLLNVLLVSGLRVGEALALEWRHVTAEGVKVEQSLENVTNGFKVNEPKSKSAYRTVPLPPTLDAMLAVLPRDKTYVFAGNGSNPYKSLRKEYKRILGKAKLPSKLRLHDLRHTACTSMLVVGMNPKVVSTLLGHSDVAFTLNTYAHYIPEWGGDVADRLESLHYSHTSRTIDGATPVPDAHS